MKRKNLAILILTIACVCFGVFGFAFTGAFAASEPKTLDEVSLNMKVGASVRKLDPTGLRFTSTMTTDDYSSLTANVGDDKAYKSVTFGMLIAPEDYVATYGELTEANVFGADAKYSVSESDTEKPRIINVFSNEMSERDGTMCFAGVITNVKSVNYNRNFVGMGYIKAIDQNGNAVYKFATANDNTRSVITVAKAALNAGESDAAGVLGGFTKYADLAGLVKSVENCYQTPANIVDYKDGVISATATAAGMYVKLDKDVIVKNGEGCDYMRLYLKSTSVAWCKILPVPASGEKQWSWFDHTLDSNGIKISDGVYEQYVDIPLNDTSVHDFSKYDIELWSGGGKDHNITITKVEYLSQEKEIVGSFLSSSSWTVAGTEAENSITIACRNVSIKSEWIKSAIEAGYTHLKFDYSMTGADGVEVVLLHSGTWNRFWRQLGTSDTMRVDLTEFHDGDTYYSFSLANRNSSAGEIDGVLTISNPVLYKSEETASWTKSNSSIYCAVEENGYIVLDTRQSGVWANVMTSSEWWEKYANNSTAGEVGQRTVTITGQWLDIKSNYRGMIWGVNGAVSSVGGTNTTEIVTEYMNDRTYAEGDKFYAGNESEGVYKFKVNSFVSSRNSSGGFSYTYVDENTFKATLLAGQKLVYVNTQEMIAAGYTKVVVTVGEYSDGQIWAGNDDWGTQYSVNGLDSGKSIELDLSLFNSDHPCLVVSCSGATVTTTITVRFF